MRKHNPNVDEGERVWVGFLSSSAFCIFIGLLYYAYQSGVGLSEVAGMGIGLVVGTIVLGLLIAALVVLAVVVGYVGQWLWYDLPYAVRKWRGGE